MAIAGIVATEKKSLLDSKVARDVPEWLIGDHARLRQVLLNLLNNAIKFTQAGSISVDVRRELADDGGERIRFSVTDTGIGIPAEQQYRLFKKFSQADSSISRQHGGTGLGLAICKQLVELMDGEIGVLSEVGKGATFWFTARLPHGSKPPIETDSKVTRQEACSDNARILVVDDLATNREIIEAYLEDTGYHVDTAGSAAEAIQMLASEPFDLVLMDVQMPNMDGVAATKRIREMPPPVRDIPIIAMTGNVLPRQVKAFLGAGMNDHVGKPIERSKLYNGVRRWLAGTDGRKARVGRDRRISTNQGSTNSSASSASKRRSVSPRIFSKSSPRRSLLNARSPTRSAAPTPSSTAPACSGSETSSRPAAPSNSCRTTTGSPERGDGRPPQGASDGAPNAYGQPAAEFARDDPHADGMRQFLDRLLPIYHGDPPVNAYFLSRQDSLARKGKGWSGQRNAVRPERRRA